MLGYRAYPRTAPESADHDSLPVTDPIARDLWRRVAAAGFRTIVAASLLGAILLIPDPLPARSSPRPASPAAVTDADAPPSDNAGIIVRSETIDVWLPESLRELGSPADRARILAEPDGLGRVLRRESSGDPRIALTTRCHRADGDHTDITFILRPLNVPDHLRWLREALVDLCDTPVGQVAEATSDDESPDAHLVPVGLLNQGQTEILTALEQIRNDQLEATH